MREAIPPSLYFHVTASRWMLRALIFPAACSAALQLELCAMMLDCILANQPPTQLGASIIAHTHARLCAYRRRTRVQHLTTQFALLLHPRSKLVTTAASWMHFCTSCCPAYAPFSWEGTETAAKLCPRHFFRKIAATLSSSCKQRHRRTLDAGECKLWARGTLCS